MVNLNTANTGNSIFETHFKSAVVMGCFFLTTIGWFAWVAFLDGVYAPLPSGKYAIRNSFTELFGADGLWWATTFIVLGILGLFEIVMKCCKRLLLIAGLWEWPPWSRSRRGENIEEWDVELWQELEQHPGMRRKLRQLCRDEITHEEEEEDDDADVQFALDEVRSR